MFVPLFEQIVTTMVRKYRPELIVLQAGMDAHVGDRLGSLQYTPAAYERAVDLIHELAHEVSAGRLLVTGGGGYVPENVSRGLARVATRLAGTWGTRVMEQSLPSEWREEFERDFHYPAPLSWTEGASPEPSPWTAGHTQKLLDTLAERLGVRWDKSLVTETDRPGGRG
jgi:acetoin utilization protein AcuC